MLGLEAGCIVDCTRLEADIGKPRLLADLLTHSGAGCNALSRLDVERTFAVRGADSGDGKV